MANLLVQNRNYLQCYRHLLDDNLQMVNENHHIIQLFWNRVKLHFNYLSAIKESDEIIISHSPSLSASINNTIIPAQECPIFKEWEYRYQLRYAW